MNQDHPARLLHYRHLGSEAHSQVSRSAEMIRRSRDALTRSEAATWDRLIFGWERDRRTTPLAD